MIAETDEEARGRMIPGSRKTNGGMGGHRADTRRAVWCVEYVAILAAFAREMAARVRGEEEDEYTAEETEVREGR